MRPLVIRLVFCLVLVFGSLGIVAATGTTPELGLDLQGGISVVLSPAKETSSEALNKAVDIIRNRVDALGVAEPQVSRQGDNIVVDLPGVRDRDRAREVVGQTAELRFRPVLEVLGPGQVPSPLAPEETEGGEESGEEGAEEGAEETPDTTIQEGAEAAQAGETTPAGDAEPDVDATELDPDEAGITEDIAGQEVILPVRGDRGRLADERLRLGPTEATGEIVRSAEALFQGGQWIVELRFTREGTPVFDDIAARYLNQRLAIVLDGVVQSYPVINAARFGGTATISGTFTEREARDLGTVLRYGALPVELEEEQMVAISPTLGRDQLRTGIAVGIFGLGLVAIYMLLYYRLLGIVVWFGLAMSGTSLYVLSSWLSHQIGLTLTLAGVTGIIVSVGYAVDSYVVYFERLKDEIRSGKTIRSSLDRGFKRAFQTIMAGNFVSLLGALILYLVAVGSVRGFAFFLGLSTVLNIFVAYFFMHPVVSILGRNSHFTQVRWLGVASGLGTEGARA